MGVFCDKLKLCSTTALDCWTGQNKGRYRKQELSFLLVSFRITTGITLGLTKSLKHFTTPLLCLPMFLLVPNLCFDYCRQGYTTEQSHDQSFIKFAGMIIVIFIVAPVLQIIMSKSSTYPVNNRV